MKKIFSSFLPLFLFSTMAFTQENCKICGDWVGVYNQELGKYDQTEDTFIPANYKLYVRIKKIDGTYIVRVKYQIADGSMAVNYTPDCIITNSTDTKISWHWDWGNDDNGGDSWGDGIAYVHNTSYLTVFLENGRLVYTGKGIIKEYNRRGDLVKQWESPHGVFPSGDRVILYKEDDDW